MTTTESTTDTSTVDFDEATRVAISKAIEGDFSQLSEYASTHLIPALLLAGIGLGVIFLGYLFASHVSQAISRPICRRVDETLGRFVGKFSFYGIFLAILGAVLSKLGAPLGGLAAMLAAAGFAIGLAFQGTLSNFASGVLMLVFRPFKVGDVIHAAGMTGKVNEIDLFHVTLDTPDNRRIIVPNSQISSGTIENISFHTDRRVEVIVGVDYSADMDKTRNALEAATAELSEAILQGEDRGSAVVLSNLGDSAVEWKVRAWVAAADYWAMHERLTAAVKSQLDSASIGIPFPQMDVHLSRVSEESSNETMTRPRVRPVRRESDYTTDSVQGNSLQP
ncbi:MAG: mechanosensitive ion channel domain-containing protein [Planctomycetota bacterium]